MDKECYRDIEKIKTIGSTYMAAVGLVPTAASKVQMYLLYLDFHWCACEVLAGFRTAHNALPKPPGQFQAAVLPECDV